MEWFSGGNLHSKNAISWQSSSYENKLATCADFIATMLEKGKLSESLSSRITTVDDIKPFSEELVRELDLAFQKHDDAKENVRIYSNQKISETAVTLAIMKGWLK